MANKDHSYVKEQWKGLRVVHSMKKDRRFREPVLLKDGPTVGGLADAQSVIHRLSETLQESSRWKYADELVSRAFAQNEKYSIMDARNQFERALKQDGLV
jgi:hypothetical protein